MSKAGPPKPVFDFPGDAFAGEYAENGFVHIKNGVTPGFVEYSLAATERLIGADADLREWKFSGKKAQFLFDFRHAGELDAIKDVVAAVTGLAREPLTLCERHLKVYDANAPEAPPPHKDRLASEVAVGIPLIVSEGSHLVLYPGLRLDINRFGSADLYRRSLDEGDLPEKALAGIEPVRLDMQPGDVVMFRGNAVFHERYKPAKSIVLYFKFNALRLDPLGEDPATPERRELALKRLEAGDEEFLKLALQTSPRLDKVTRLYSRLAWSEILQAQVWGEKEFAISEIDLALLKAADGRTALSGLLRNLGFAPIEFGALLPAVRRLVRLQALDLVPAEVHERKACAGQSPARAAAEIEA